MPYLIVVYDVNVARVDNVRHFLKRYLDWVQNSVLEGEVTKAQAREINSGLKELIKPREDSVLLYQLTTDRYLKRTLLGVEKGSLDTIL